MSKINWTDDRVNLLAQLWNDGKSASEIATVLGGVTRNAVIGKAHRMGLSGRPSPIQRNVKPRNKVVKLPQDKPVDGGIKMMELSARTCRWPLGDPKESDFSFCGCAPVPGLPYCPEHAARAYQNFSKRKGFVELTETKKKARS